MNLDSSIVIGNGESRKLINLQNLTGRITMIGCNAVHRDCIVDHLVCCDSRMVREAIDNDNNAETLIYVRDDWYHHFKKMLKHRNIRLLPEIPYVGHNRADAARNWGSGTYALLLASTLPFEKIFVLGFDLYGNRTLVNNVYKGTKNYNAENSHAVDPSYWIYQCHRVFNHYQDKKYIVINYPSWKFPDTWRLSNVEFLDIDKLHDQLQIQ